MDKNFCEFYHLCKVDDCPFRFKKQCKNYVGWYILKSLKEIPGKIDYTANSYHHLIPGIYFGKNSSKLKTILFEFLIRDGIKTVKYLSYNRAIQVALSDEVLEQKVIFIDMSPNYKDIEKGIQTIESLAESLAEQRKIVILLVKPMYQNPSYQKLC